MYASFFQAVYCQRWKFFRLKPLKTISLYQDNNKSPYFSSNFFSGLNSLKSPNQCLSSDASGIRDIGFTIWGCGSKIKLLRLISWFKSYSLSSPKKMNFLLLTTTTHSNWEGTEQSFLVRCNSLKERQVPYSKESMHLTSL